jgi:hypothetical protein
MIDIRWILGMSRTTFYKHGQQKNMLEEQLQ